MIEWLSWLIPIALLFLSVWYGVVERVFANGRRTQLQSRIAARTGTDAVWVESTADTIVPFARLKGLGTDLLQFAQNGSNVHGIDLTSGAVDLTRRRFELAGLDADLKQASFTKIPFEDDRFDLVYSFGVLHHSQETQEGIDEILRVLKPGGRAIIMLYHKGFKYYVRKLFLYGVLRGELLRKSPQEIVNRHSEDFGESPLTRVFSRRGARAMFGRYEGLSMRCYRLDDYVPFRGRPVSPSRRLLPGPAYRALENLLGWNLVIKGTKPSS